MRGIGTDIVEIERIAQAIEKQNGLFLHRIFTERERQYCQQHRHCAMHFAGRFAAKEAISKALGVGIGAQLDWLDIEISYDKQGKPLAVFSQQADAYFNFPRVLVSISHCKQYATSFAIWLE